MYCMRVRERESEMNGLPRIWVCNGMYSGRGRDRVAGTAVRPGGPSTLLEELTRVGIHVSMHKGCILYDSHPRISLRRT